jgi:aminomethyltransferase
MTEDRRPFLHDVHVELGAKIVPFGGWAMPLQYGNGTVSEHLACRRDAVVFDVSHLGTVRAVGDHFDALQFALSNDLRRVEPGRAQYTHLLNNSGGVDDDIIVWWISEHEFDVMPNASNTERVRAALPGDDVTAQRSVLAVQGPNARAKVATVDARFAEVPRFRVRRFDVDGTEVRVAGTGYTGEDGIEIAAPNNVAEQLWRRLIAAEITPAGLGARDTLRLEAALPLHGHELSSTISPLEARLGWVIGWDKDEFVGRAALVKQPGLLRGRGCLRPRGPRRRARARVALGVRDGLHALPARGRPGRPAGHLRVPDHGCATLLVARRERVALRRSGLARRGPQPVHGGIGTPADPFVLRRAPALARRGVDVRRGHRPRAHRGAAARRTDRLARGQRHRRGGGRRGRPGQLARLPGRRGQGPRTRRCARGAARRRHGPDRRRRVARGVRARPGRPLHPAEPPPVLGRPRGLPARVVHHEVQPQAVRHRGGLPGLADVHPPRRPRCTQGWLQLLVELEEQLCEITGMAAATLQPAAGAAGRAHRAAAHAGLPRPGARPATR